MNGLCLCGCGGLTPLASQTDRKRGYVKGQPKRYMYRHGPNYRTGKDYVQCRDGHEHRLIAARVLGKPMPSKAQVHHVDENRRNNTHRNLVICEDMAYHKLLHARSRILRAGGNPNTERLCSRCKRILPIDAFGKSTARQLGTQNACRRCGGEYRRAKKVAA